MSWTTKLTLLMAIHRPSSDTPIPLRLKTLLKDALGRLTGDAVGKERDHFAWRRPSAVANTAQPDRARSTSWAALPGQRGVPTCRQRRHAAGSRRSIRSPAWSVLDLDPDRGYPPRCRRHRNPATLRAKSRPTSPRRGGRGRRGSRERETQGRGGAPIWFEPFVGRPADVDPRPRTEIARHLRVAMAVPTATSNPTCATKPTLRMSLLEFASSKQRCLVVLTLAGESDVFAVETELLRKKLAETLKISARQGSEC